MKLIGILIPLATVAVLLCGCQSPEPSGDVIMLVPGVGGDVGYGQMIRGLKDGGAKAPVMKVAWGAPLPFFVLNFSSNSIHQKAEATLAQEIATYTSKHPDAKIDLIGHSAGCGVLLGALGRLPSAVNVRTVVMLAPSVSPTYDLAPSSKHVAGAMHSFYSERDTLFLSWRVRHFGTYDNVKAPAAGNQGFDPRLVRSLDGKLVDHPYDPAWEKLGNNGGHFDCLAREFTSFVIAPALIPPAHGDQPR